MRRFAPRIEVGGAACGAHDVNACEVKSSTRNSRIAQVIQSKVSREPTDDRELVSPGSVHRLWIRHQPHEMLYQMKNMPARSGV